MLKVGLSLFGVLSAIGAVLSAYGLFSGWAVLPESLKIQTVAVTASGIVCSLICFAVAALLDGQESVERKVDRLLPREAKDEPPEIY